MSRNAPDLRSRLQQALGSAYTLKRELGGGGMARVFLADENALGRPVVIKVLAPELSEDLSAERFTREVRLAARLQHPNILPVFTAGIAGGVSYYTMPYVEGESLRVKLEGDSRLSTADSVAVLRDVARAIAHAHEHGVVHRDIKPDNILLSRDAAVVADFGIAKAVEAAQSLTASSTLTQRGAAIGTPAYMAPEQVAGEEVDSRADLYAWGVVAYEILSGRHPFAGKQTAQALLVAHLVETPTALSIVRPELFPALVALVMRCLAKTPADRPASARELLEVLGTLTSAGEVRATVSRVSPPSVAVLPFVNLSGDPESEYFSDGMSEEILSMLAQDLGLRVAARSSSFAFKNKQVNLRTIADTLHVSAILEGTVRRAGNRVRITAQLVNAADGYHLWSERFDRELTDIFAVQEEIAGAIAPTLARRLRELSGSPTTAAEPTVAPGRRTRQRVSIDAYDEYLRGRYANHMRGVGHQQALHHFERALTFEPDFAAACAGLGETYMWLGIFFGVAPTEAFARARKYAQRALSIDPDLADAHWLLAEVALWYDWDVEASKSHIESALALEPYHAGSLMTTALCYVTRCQKSEALAAAASAVRVDPLGLGTRIWFLATAFNVHDYDLTIAEATRLIAEQPSYSEAYRWRAMAAISTGDLTRARADLEKAAELVTPNVWWHVNSAILASQDGNPGETRRIRDELLRRSLTEWVPQVALGQVEQALGDYDGAIAYYERAYQMRDFLMFVFHTDPAFRIIPPGKETSIADDVRWIDIARRIGLSPDADKRSRRILNHP